MTAARRIITGLRDRSIANVFLFAIASAFLWTGHAEAQNRFAPVARVNEQVVTQYELEQRMRFLRALNQRGSSRDDALDNLIDDRLRMQAARAAGVVPSETEIQAGLEEFSSRANLDAATFTRLLAQEGVDRETFRDFVTAGLAWREVVRARFAPRTQITEPEIDRAIALASGRGGVRVLLSEIIIPAPEGQAAEARQLANRLSRIRSTGEFAAAARQYSAAASRNQGGRIEWLPIGNLPPELRTQVLTLAPGQVTAPVELGNAIAVFQLRALEETGRPDTETLSVEYATYYIGGARDGRAREIAQELRGEVDTCDDLYGVAKGQPPEVLERQTLPISDVPDDIAMELAKLDDNEVSTALTRGDGDTLVFLMLCGRVTALAEDISREQVRSQLLNQRLATYAESYLAQLRADATIIME